MDENTTPEQQEPEGIRNLREANERLKQDADAGKAAQRKLAFYEAGLNPEADPKVKLLLKAYDGELNPEDIRAAAVEYGIVEETPPAPPAPPAPGDANDPQQTDVRRSLGADSLDPGAPVPDGDPMDKGYATFHADRRDGATAAEASGAVFGAMFEAARNGDPRFAFDQEAWQNSESAKSR